MVHCCGDMDVKFLAEGDIEFLTNGSIENLNSLIKDVHESKDEYCRLYFATSRLTFCLRSLKLKDSDDIKEQLREIQQIIVLLPKFSSDINFRVKLFELCDAYHGHTQQYELFAYLGKWNKNIYAEHNSLSPNHKNLLFWRVYHESRLGGKDFASFMKDLRIVFNKLRNTDDKAELCSAMEIVFKTQHVYAWESIFELCTKLFTDCLTFSQSSRLMLSSLSAIKMAFIDNDYTHLLKNDVALSTLKILTKYYAKMFAAFDTNVENFFTYKNVILYELQQVILLLFLKNTKYSRISSLEDMTQFCEKMLVEVTGFDETRFWWIFSNRLFKGLKILGSYWLEDYFLEIIIVITKKPFFNNESNNVYFERLVLLIEGILNDIALHSTQIKILEKFTAKVFLSASNEDNKVFCNSKNTCILSTYCIFISILSYKLGPRAKKCLAKPINSNIEISVVELLVNLLDKEYLKSSYFVLIALKHVIKNVPSCVNSLIDKITSKVNPELVPSVNTYYLYGLSALISTARDNTIGIPIVKLRNIFDLLMAVACKFGEEDIDSSSNQVCNFAVWLALSSICTLDAPTVKYFLNDIFNYISMVFSLKIYSEKDVLSYHTYVQTVFSLNALLCLIKHCPELIDGRLIAKFESILDTTLTITVSCQKSDSPVFHFLLYQLLYFEEIFSSKRIRNDLLHLCLRAFMMVHAVQENIWKMSVVYKLMDIETRFKDYSSVIRDDWSKSVYTDNLTFGFSEKMGLLLKTVDKLDSETYSFCDIKHHSTNLVTKICKFITCYLTEVPEEEVYSVINSIIQNTMYDQNVYSLINSISIIIQSLKDLLARQRIISNCYFADMITSFYEKLSSYPHDVIRCLLFEMMAVFYKVTYNINDADKFLLEFYGHAVSSNDSSVSQTSMMGIALFHYYLNHNSINSRIDADISLLLSFCNSHKSLSKAHWARCSLTLLISGPASVKNDSLADILSSASASAFKLRTSDTLAFFDICRLVNAVMLKWDISENIKLNTVHLDAIIHIMKESKKKFLNKLCLVIFRSYSTFLTITKSDSLLSKTNIMLTFALKFLQEDCCSYLKLHSIKLIKHLCTVTPDIVTELSKEFHNSSNQLHLVAVVNSSFQAFLFAAYDSMLTSRKCIKNLREAIEILVIYCVQYCEKSLISWFNVFKNILSSSKDIESSNFKHGTSDPNESAAKNVHETVHMKQPSWDCREYALFLMSEILKKCKEDSFNVTDKVLLANINQIMKVSLVAATSKLESVRLGALKILHDVVRLYGTYPDPQSPHLILIEQYHLQIKVALTISFKSKVSSTQMELAFKICTEWLKAMFYCSNRTSYDQKILDFLLDFLQDFTKKDRNLAQIVYNEECGQHRILSLLNSWASLNNSYLIHNKQKCEHKFTFSEIESFLIVLEIWLPKLIFLWKKVIKEYSYVMLEVLTGSELPEKFKPAETILRSEHLFSDFLQKYTEILLAVAFHTTRGNTIIISENGSEPDIEQILMMCFMLLINDNECFDKEYTSIALDGITILVKSGLFLTKLSTKTTMQYLNDIENCLLRIILGCSKPVYFTTIIHIISNFLNYASYPHLQKDVAKTFSRMTLNLFLLLIFTWKSDLLPSTVKTKMDSIFSALSRRKDLGNVLYTSVLEIVCNFVKFASKHKDHISLDQEIVVMLAITVRCVEHIFVVFDYLDDGLDDLKNKITEIANFFCLFYQKFYSGFAKDLCMIYVQYWPNDIYSNNDERKCVFIINLIFNMILFCGKIKLNEDKLCHNASDTMMNTVMHLFETKCMNNSIVKNQLLVFLDKLGHEGTTMSYQLLSNVFKNQFLSNAESLSEDLMLQWLEDVQKLLIGKSSEENLKEYWDISIKYAIYFIKKSTDEECYSCSSIKFVSDLKERYKDDLNKFLEKNQDLNNMLHNYLKQLLVTSSSKLKSNNADDNRNKLTMDFSHFK